ncbi:hypothetical protein ACFYKX_08820 [Cytobacillus sp. FJAT-54145]|uniref:Uncharacterized protein n=1 Tax=Cytobacillus spartinae TaxID=3299023 RepID=A0ABW6K984_9BACI
MALRQSDIDFIASQIVSETVERQGNALIETVAGNDQLVKVAKQYMNCSSDFTQGRMFEIIESTKFNVNAAKAGSMLRAITTDQLGMPHHEADILIRNKSGDILREIQAKSSDKASNLARAVADSKYNGMDRLVNVEHEAKVNDLVEKRMNSGSVYAQDYKDAHGSIKGQLQHDDIKSGGTTHNEAKYAAENPDSYAFKSNTAEFLSGAKNAMLGGALAGAFVGGTMNTIHGVYKGDFCVKETGKAAANSAARGAVVSGVAYGLKYVGKNSVLMSGNVASALASSAVNMTELTYKYLSGKISTEEFVEGLGSNALSCFSGIIMTAAGAALFGPVGAALAGTVALMGMKQLYKVFTNAREDLALAKEARAKAETLSKMIIQQVREEEKILIAYYSDYQETLVELKKVVDLAVVDTTFTEQAIVSLANGLNITFKYDTLDEFNDFMLSDEVLEL